MVDDHLEVAVEDKGPGVPVTLREKIFQPWVKLGSTPGVGLGLAICKTAVDEMGGSIGCGDRVDGQAGARLWFRVPAIPHVGSSILSPKLHIPQGGQGMQSSLTGSTAGPSRPALFGTQTAASHTTVDQSRKDRGVDSGSSASRALSRVNLSHIRRDSQLKQTSLAKESPQWTMCRAKVVQGVILMTSPFLDRAMSSLRSVGDAFIGFLTQVSPSMELRSRFQEMATDFNARLVALRHGQELVSTTALALSALMVLWIFISAFLQDYLLGVISTLSCVNYFGISYIRSPRVAVMCTNVQMLVSVAIVSLYLDGVCNTSVKSINSVIPLFSSLLFPDLRITITVGIVCMIMAFFLNYQVECSGPTAQINQTRNLFLDITFAALCYSVGVAYELQWRVVETLREQFMCGLSQELRTPLHGVMCAAEVLLARDTLSDSERENVQTIMGCGQLLSSLVNNILDAGEMSSTASTSEQAIYQPEKVGLSSYLLRSVCQYLFFSVCLPLSVVLVCLPLSARLCLFVPVCFLY